jgi:hypothetical protein
VAALIVTGLSQCDHMHGWLGWVHDVGVVCRVKGEHLGSVAQHARGRGGALGVGRLVWLADLGGEPMDPSPRVMNNEKASGPWLDL